MRTKEPMLQHRSNGSKTAAYSNEGLACGYMVHQLFDGNLPQPKYSCLKPKYPKFGLTAFKPLTASA